VPAETTGTATSAPGSAGAGVSDVGVPQFWQNAVLGATVLPHFEQYIGTPLRWIFELQREYYGISVGEGSKQTCNSPGAIISLAFSSKIAWSQCGGGYKFAERAGFAAKIECVERLPGNDQEI